MSQKFVPEIAVSTAASRIYESGVIEICHLGDEPRAKHGSEFAFDDFDVEHARNGAQGRRACCEWICERNAAQLTRSHTRQCLKIGREMARDLYV